MKKLIVLFFIIEIAYSQEGVWTSTISEVIEFEVKNKIEPNYWDDAYYSSYSKGYISNSGDKVLDNRIVLEVSDTLIKVTSIRDYQYEEGGENIKMIYEFINDTLHKTTYEYEVVDYKPIALDLLNEDKKILDKLGINYYVDEVQEIMIYESSKGLTHLSIEIGSYVSPYSSEYVLYNKYKRERFNP